MRSSGVLVVLLLVVGSVLLIDTDVDCEAAVEKIEEEPTGEHGGSESWAEWAKDKLSDGLGFKAGDDQDSGSTNQVTKDKVGCVKEKACGPAGKLETKAAEACEEIEEAKDKLEEKVSDMGKKVSEEVKKRVAEAEDTLNWAKEKANEGYEAAKNKAEETYESGKEKLAHHQEL